jgi:spore germination protein GerM
MVKAILGIVVSIGIITNIHVEGTKAIDLYYYQEEEQDIKLIKTTDKVKKGSLEKVIRQSLEKLINNEKGRLSLIPEETVIKMVIYFEGELFIDFSRDILNYGGTTWEKGMVDQILSVVFQFDEVNKVSFYIEGELENLVEGTIIKGYTRNEWKERKCINEENK